MPTPNTTLNAHVDLETDHKDPVFRGPFAQDFAWPLSIGDDGKVDAAAFPQLDVIGHAADGTEVRLRVLYWDGGQGSFDRATRVLQVAITLRVQRIVYADVALALSTQGSVAGNDGPISGQPVAANGRLVLVGEGTLHSIVPEIEGTRCMVKVSGELSPAPKP